MSPTWVESMIPATPKPKEEQAFELSPLVEQPQSPNGHVVMTVQPSLQPALYERNENASNDNSTKESSKGSVRSMQ